MATTTGFWRHLPTPLGADDRLALDAPLGAGTLQTIASNATHAARQNNLGTLWEHPGGDVFATMDGSDPADDLAWWRTDVADGGFIGGAFVRYCGAHRIRPWGETTSYPSIELRARMSAPSGYGTGIVLVARPAIARPSSGDLHTSTTTISTTPVDVSLSLASERIRAALGSQSVACRTPGDATLPTETGDLPIVHLWVGAWCTSNSSGSKGNLSGLTIFLKAPP